MNLLPVSLRWRIAPRRALRSLHGLPLVFLLAVAAVVALPARAATALADQPIFASANPPGNLALALSVEFPTAISVAHTNRTYVAASQYLGYFDPDKCYTYHYSDGTSTDNYFQPNSLASSHVCSGKWSGNFLNWATMQTIDPFRWALTGGYRVIDTATLTVVEKAWGTTQGGVNNFPNSVLPSTAIAGATPFPASAGNLYMRIWGLGNKMRFAMTDQSSTALSFAANYYNNQTATGTVVLSRTDSAIDFDWGNGSPGAGVNSDGFSGKWALTIAAPLVGNYVFRVKADDTVQVSINNTQVINQTSYQSMNYQYSGNVPIIAGQALKIDVVMSENVGGAGIQLQWKRPGDSDYSTIGPVPSLYAAAAPVPYGSTASVSGGTVYEVFARVKTCDATVGIEENCTKYGSNYKPEGLMQKYANKIRYSALGYLNDSAGAGNPVVPLRDGGVLRARQKFIGPTQPVAGSVPVDNAMAVDGGPAGQITGKEWSAVDGTFTLNPDRDDASNTSGIMGIPTGTVTNSGVINYLNKFGEVTPGSYKTYDSVGELYYAAIRYFKNLPAVPEWTAWRTGSTQADAITWTDGFPVITSPADPILYSCQRNFILGIGDVNTHADKDVPGNTNAAQEPGMPALVIANASGPDGVNAVDATNKLGVLETVGSGSLGSGSLGTVSPYNGAVSANGAISGTGACCNSNSALMAGLAYDAHIKDIRGRATGSSLPVPQTIDTYWVDVQENQVYKDYNQFYLATKYGGFTVPAGYTMSNTAPLLNSAWHTNTDTLSANNLRPDNYFSGGRPDLMKAGLDAAFGKIADGIGGAYTTSFSTALPQIATSGNASYSSLYDAKNWTGEITASTLSFDAAIATTTLVQQWNNKTFTAILAAQLAGTGWSNNRRVLTWAGTPGSGVAFRADTTTSTTQIVSTDLSNLDTSYVSGDDSSNYLNYLRGERTNEIGCLGSTCASTLVYRARIKLLGDVVGSKVRPVGPPSFPFSDATNPGYGAFKTQWTTTTPRRTVIYFGANDGMLHAVNGALTDVSTSTPPLETDANYGKEMFAYIPRALFQGPTAPNTDGLASLGKPSFAHHYMVDATPNISDVDFARVPTSATPPAKQTPASTTSDWHSVLIGGLGKGGKAYYALDVTDPVSMATGTEDSAAAKVLWEFSNSTTGMSGELGFSYGDPLVMKTKKYGWVVMFTSGYNNTDGKGYFIFVNPKTGALLEPPVPTSAGSSTSDSGLAHANAFIVDATDGTADAVYAGDLLGNVWRLDVSSATGLYSAAGKLVNLAVLTDASAANNRQPVTSRPSIEVSPKTRKRYVMIGTGRLLDSTDVASTQGQTFYTIADGTNAAFNAMPFPPDTTKTYPITRSQLTENTNVTDEVSFDAATKVGWFEELGLDPGTAATTTPPAAAIPSTGFAFRVISDSTAASGSVSFASTLPNGAVCSPSGISRIYARNYATAQTTLTDDLAYVPLSSVATDLLYVSVGGKLRLLAGTKDGGNPTVIPITQGSGFSLRRLNWRELQVVD